MHSCPCWEMLSLVSGCSFGLLGKVRSVIISGAQPVSAFPCYLYVLRLLCTLLHSVLLIVTDSAVCLFPWLCMCYSMCVSLCDGVCLLALSRMCLVMAIMVTIDFYVAYCESRVTQDFLSWRPVQRQTLPLCCGCVILFTLSCLHLSCRLQGLLYWGAAGRLPRGCNSPHCVWQALCLCSVSYFKLKF